MYEHLESQVQFHYSLLFHRITQKKRTEWVLRSLGGGCLLKIWVWLTGRVSVVTVGQNWALMWLQKAALHQSGNVEQSSCCPLINLPLTLPSKWLAWMLHHFLIKAYFQRELPVFRKIRLPSCCCFLHLKLYSLCNLKKKMSLKGILNMHLSFVWWKLFLSISQNEILWWLQLEIVIITRPMDQFCLQGYTYIKMTKSITVTHLGR